MLEGPRKDGFGAYFLLCIAVMFVGVCLAALSTVLFDLLTSLPSLSDLMTLPFVILFVMLIGLAAGAALLPVAVLFGWPVWTRLRRKPLQVRVLGTVVAWTVSTVTVAFVFLSSVDFGGAASISKFVGIGGVLSMLVAPRLAKRIFEPQQSKAY